jgi:hypothetical protein
LVLCEVLNKNGQKTLFSVLSIESDKISKISGDCSSQITLVNDRKQHGSRRYPVGKSVHPPHSKVFLDLKMKFAQTIRVERLTSIIKFNEFDTRRSQFPS